MRKSPKLQKIRKLDRWRYTHHRYQLRDCLAENHRIAKALQASPDRKVREKGDRVQCCSEAFQVRSKLSTLESKLQPMSCDVIVCKACGHHRWRTTLRSADYRFDVRPPADWLAERGKNPAEEQPLRFLSVTQGRSDEYVRDSAERLALAIRRFRRSAAFRHHVWGGFIRFEVTHNRVNKRAVAQEQRGKRWCANKVSSVDDGWHWHAHMVICGVFWKSRCKGANGEYWEDPETCPCRSIKRKVRCKRSASGWREIRDPRQRCITCAWYDATGGTAKVVDIRVVYGEGDTVEARKGSAKREAIKYVCKHTDLDDSALREFVGGMGRFQFSRWIGGWFGVKEPKEPKELAMSAAPSDILAVAAGLKLTCLARVSAAATNVELLEYALTDVGAVRLVQVRKGDLAVRGPPGVYAIVTKKVALAIVERVDKIAEAMRLRTEEHYERNPQDYLDLIGDLDSLPF